MDEFVKHQANTQHKDFDIKYLTIGLMGEMGELCNEIKKLERDDNNIMTKDRMDKIKLEMGDVLWYYVGITQKLGININELMQLNIKKLKK